MISKAKLKLIHSLERRKRRQEESLFVAEGPRLLDELLPLMQPVFVAALPAWLESNSHRLSPDVETCIVTPDELHRASLMQAPQQVVALFPLPHPTWDDTMAHANLCLALDGVQDPGNMGTICRVADWFGITDILCSTDTVDVFNPKAVQATMGALARVRVHYLDLPSLLSRLDVPVYGTFLDGMDIYKKELNTGELTKSLIVIGNESNGISKEVAGTINERLYIPPYPPDDPGSESLNAAVATAVTVAEFRRRLISKA